MRIAIVSDVHGNLVALEAVLADIALRAPDAIVNLGDCATSPLWPRETMDLLETLALPTVRGNHDRWLAERDAADLSPSMAFARDALDARQLDLLGRLPARLELEPGVLAVHGAPSGDTDYLLEENVGGRLALVTPDVLARRLGDETASLVLCGHSHHQHSAADARGRLVVNPGSVGCPRHAGHDAPARCEASSPHARYAVATRGASGRWGVELVVLEYDWSAAARRAEANERPEWASAYR